MVQRFGHGYAPQTFRPQADGAKHVPEFELDKWKIRDLHEYFKRGRLTLKPPYQRGRAWSDEMRMALIDTVLRDFPMGVILLDETKDQDKRELWDTVDGQQRCTTLTEYVDGTQDWTKSTPPPGSDFVRYSLLSPAQQDRFQDYHLPVAKLRNYTEQDIREIFVRIQYGKALTGGEKIKAMNSPYKEHVATIAGHKVFSDWAAAFQYRDSHWAMAGEFLQGFYNDRPLERREYRLLDKFLRDKGKFDEGKAKRAVAEGRSVLNYTNRVISECVTQDPRFRRLLSVRLLKWLVASVSILKKHFAISGREPDFATAVLDYWKAKDDPASAEYDSYFHTLRSGRIDTDEVKICLEQLMNRIVLRAQLKPSDPKRFFSPAQRKEILEASGGKCQGMVAGQPCGATLTATNFHADHIVAHSVGGPTNVGNGQALCSACNLGKGKSSALAEIFAA